MGGKQECPALMKKGAWTAEEDEKLVSFIRTNNGHGSWRTLPQLAGLQRCGKSCRLRWTNYLRPNIKRGNFTKEEEWTITQLHALLGNKWSSIAARLPGRTDNEVKNHWNIHLRKRLSRMGIDPVTHRPARLCLANFNNVKPAIKAGSMMKQRRHSSSSGSSFNCNSESQKKALPRVLSVVDQSYVSHMAQWELARLEAERRQTAGAGMASTVAPSPSDQAAASSSAGSKTRQSWVQRDQYEGQAAGNENDQLLEVLLGELLEACPRDAELVAAGSSCSLQDKASRSSSSAGSPDHFLQEGDISSDITSLIHDLSSASPSPSTACSSSPSPVEPLLALVPTSPILPHWESIYWPANCMLSLVGPVISSCPR